MLDIETSLRLVDCPGRDSRLLRIDDERVSLLRAIGQLAQQELVCLVLLRLLILVQLRVAQQIVR